MTKRNGTTHKLGGRRFKQRRSVGSVHVLLFNSQNSLLVSRRSANTDWGGKLNASAGGRIEANEAPITAAHRELREELGIDTDLRLVMEFPMARSDADSVVNYVFEGAYNGEALSIDKVEVHSTRFYTIPELIVDMSNNSSHYTPYFREVFVRYLDAKSL